MTAREVLDELERWGRNGYGLRGADGAEVHAMWLKRLRSLRETVEEEARAWDAPAPTVPDAPIPSLAGLTGGLRAMYGAQIAAEPTALEVALRLVESGKVAAVPRQAAAFACDLIDCIRARQSKEVGR